MNGSPDSFTPQLSALPAARAGQEPGCMPHRHGLGLCEIHAPRAGRRVLDAGRPSASVRAAGASPTVSGPSHPGQQLLVGQAAMSAQLRGQRGGRALLSPGLGGHGRPQPAPLAGAPRPAGRRQGSSSCAGGRARAQAGAEAGPMPASWDGRPGRTLEFPTTSPEPGADPGLRAAGQLSLGAGQRCSAEAGPGQQGARSRCGHELRARPRARPGGRSLGRAPVLRSFRVGDTSCVCRVTAKATRFDSPPKKGQPQPELAEER